MELGSPTPPTSPTWTYAGRAKALDADGAIRLQAAGVVLAAWVGVLQGSGILAEGTVLGLRTFAPRGAGRARRPRRPDLRRHRPHRAGLGRLRPSSASRRCGPWRRGRP